MTKEEAIDWARVHLSLELEMAQKYYDEELSGPDSFLVLI
jgi:hypothetical protein